MQLHINIQMKLFVSSIHMSIEFDISKLFNKHLSMPKRHHIILYPVYDKPNRNLWSLVIAVRSLILKIYKK